MIQFNWQKQGKQMWAELLKVADKFPDKVGAALYKEAQIEMTEAKRRCPVSKGGGTLRASGMVHEPQRFGKTVFVVLSFGGAAIDYAVAVHEHLSEHSPPSWVAAEANGDGIHWTSAGTGPKFLESVLNESRSNMASRIAARLKFNEEKE